MLEHSIFGRGKLQLFFSSATQRLKYDLRAWQRPLLTSKLLYAAKLGPHRNNSCRAKPSGPLKSGKKDSDCDDGKRCLIMLAGRAGGWWAARVQHCIGSGAYCDAGRLGRQFARVTRHVAIIIPVLWVAMHDQPCLKVGLHRQLSASTANYCNNRLGAGANLGTQSVTRNRSCFFPFEHSHLLRRFALDTALRNIPWRSLDNPGISPPERPAKHLTVFWTGVSKGIF